MALYLMVYYVHKYWGFALSVVWQKIIMLVSDRKNLDEMRIKNIYMDGMRYFFVGFCQAL